MFHELLKHLCLQISMSVKLEPITATYTPYVQTQQEASNVVAALAGLEMVSSAQVRILCICIHL